ncbi:hypothetical protein EBB07_30630 [Paenibacillaceae bacterium]|nr:hypothetical protein EBB07_30630 [Paenibacillaceae bacterium]
MTKKFNIKVSAGILTLLLTLGASNAITPALAESFADEENTSSTRYLSDDFEFLLEISALPELDDHWSKELFVWAMNYQIVHGYSNGSYQPDRPVSEAELLKMLFKLLGAALPGSTGPNWEEGPYRMAKHNNLPAKGIERPSEKFKAVNRQTAAEIVAGITGVNYSGENAIRYLVGNQLIPVELDPSLETFDGEASLTRAEALAWLRVLSLKGYMNIGFRPQEPSNPSLLHESPQLTPIQNTEYFSYIPVTTEDLYVYDKNNSSQASIKLGMNKTEVDSRFSLTDEEQDIFDNFNYSNLKVGFDKNGLVNRWNVYDHEDGNPHPLVTSRGIQPGKSTLSDVIKKYGTGGYSGNDILEYVFEIDPKGVLQPVTDRRFTRHNTDGYILSFIIDRETKVVWYASVMTYKYAYYDFYDSF